MGDFGGAAPEANCQPSGLDETNKSNGADDASCLIRRRRNSEGHHASTGSWRTAGWFERLTLSFATPLLRKKDGTPLKTYDDFTKAASRIPRLSTSYQTNLIASQISKLVVEQNNNRERDLSVFRILIRLVAPCAAPLAILRLLELLMSSLSPLLLKAIVANLEGPADEVRASPATSAAAELEEREIGSMSINLPDANGGIATTIASWWTAKPHFRVLILSVFLTVAVYMQVLASVQCGFQMRKVALRAKNALLAAIYDAALRRRHPLLPTQNCLAAATVLQCETTEGGFKWRASGNHSVCDTLAYHKNSTAPPLIDCSCKSCLITRGKPACEVSVQAGRQTHDCGNQVGTRIFSTDLDIQHTDNASGKMNLERAVNSPGAIASVPGDLTQAPAASEHCELFKTSVKYSPLPCVLNHSSKESTCNRISCVNGVARGQAAGGYTIVDLEGASAEHIKVDECILRSGSGSNGKIRRSSIAGLEGTSDNVINNNRRVERTAFFGNKIDSMVTHTLQVLDGAAAAAAATAATAASAVKSAAKTAEMAAAVAAEAVAAAAEKEAAISSDDGSYLSVRPRLGPNHRSSGTCSQQGGQRIVGLQL